MTLDEDSGVGCHENDQHIQRGDRPQGIISIEAELTFVSFVMRHC